MMLEVQDLPLRAAQPGFLPRLPVLGRNQVVVVEVDLDIPERLSRALLPILDEADRARAARFVFPDHRRRYLASHAALRLVLAHYLDEEPRLLKFERGTHGKTRLAGSWAADYEINLSHSADRALIAVARSREVGIDIEVHRPDLDVYSLAQYVLSPAERHAFAAFSTADRRAAFFRAWTRKESFVKATGEGLACPLHSFDVSLEEDVDSALLRCRHTPAAFERWTTIPLDVGPGAAAALTVREPARLLARVPSVWTFA